MFHEWRTPMNEIDQKTCEARAHKRLDGSFLILRDPDRCGLCGYNFIAMGPTAITWTGKEDDGKALVGPPRGP